VVTKRLEIEDFSAVFETEISKEGKIWGLKKWAGLEATIVVHDQARTDRKRSDGRREGGER
jgi:hypothetical protein